jgi:glutaconyl-CoA/methylmalonyl-CoA decarboxylase subunit gamma
VRKFNITVNGEVYEVEVEELGNDGAVAPVQSRPAAKPAPAPARKPAAKAAPKQAKKVTSVSAGAASVTAPMPGVVLDVKVSEGQSVKKNDVIMILEAMKMENEVMAPQDGVIESVAVSKGSNVNAGDIMIVIK